MGGGPKKARNGKPDELRWLLAQTIAVFLLLLAAVCLVTGDWKGAIVTAAGADAFLIAIYFVTGNLLFKGAGR